MGWIQKLIKNIKQNTQYAGMLNGYSPVFSQFGSDIYASDVVQQSISCIVNEIKKLKPMHIRKAGNDVESVGGNIQKILDNPNELMTTSEFLEKITWQLYLNNNSFIIPDYTIWKDQATGQERREYRGLYPIQPQQVDFIEDAAGKLYVHFRFANGYESTISYQDVIHIKRNYAVNDYMGGNEFGQPDNEALLKTLELNHMLLEGVAKAMKSSFAVNAVVKYNTLLDANKTEAALKEIQEKLAKSESGLLPLDLKAEYIPIKKEIKLVDEATLKFIDGKILRNFGVPLPILTGDFTKSQYEAFYQKTLEPLIISITQAFTKKIFTDGQKAYGNQIQLYPEDLIFMTVDQTLEMIRLLGDSGALYENEKRVALGMRPDASLNGKRMQSLNYVDIDIARNYQIGQIKGEKGEGTTDEA